MASGWKQEGSSTSKVILHIVDEGGKGSAPPQPTSENGKGEQKKNGIGEQKKKGKGEQKTNGNKKKKGKGNGDVFRVQGNNIHGGKADKCGVFGFGNKYYGRKKPKEDESSDEEVDSSDEDQEDED